MSESNTKPYAPTLTEITMRRISEENTTLRADLEKAKNDYAFQSVALEQTHAQLLAAEKALDEVKNTDIGHLSYGIFTLQTAYLNIVKEAILARSSHSVKGHHCELRTTIDSICDRKPKLLSELRDVANAYKTLALSTIADLRAKVGELEKDKERLDYLESECFDVRCHDIPTGQGDADVGWVVISHHIAKPREREEGIGGDSIRSAIDSARNSNPTE